MVVPANWSRLDEITNAGGHEERRHREREGRFPGNATASSVRRNAIELSRWPVAIGILACRIDAVTQAWLRHP